MMQQDEPADYVIATGETHTVREFCEVCFARVGLPLRWEGKAEDEKGYGPEGRLLVQIDPRYYRPAEVDVLLGDSSKAHRELGWKPKVTFRQLAEMMADADLVGAQEAVQKGEGGEEKGE